VVAFALSDSKSKQKFHEMLNTFGNRFITERNDVNQSILCYLLADNLA
jgi:hypothetical protein